ncbi:MAG: glycosyltransferase family protein [Pseudomonadota bacterium]
MEIAVIIQARMGSSRLPGKSLKKIGPDYLIEKLIKRLSLSSRVTKIIFAVPDKPMDDPLAQVLSNNKVLFYRGSEDDVLDRYYQAARVFKADTVIRVTGDCPLIDPGIVDGIIGFYLEADGAYDYVSNSVTRSYPRGFDCEVFSFSVLEEIWEKADKPHEREHVTPYIYQHPDAFRIYHRVAPESLFRPDYRICVDTLEDLSLVDKIFDHFNGRNDMNAKEIVDLLDSRPDLVGINSHIVQKTLTGK